MENEYKPSRAATNETIVWEHEKKEALPRSVTNEAELTHSELVYKYKNNFSSWLAQSFTKMPPHMLEMLQRLIHANEDEEIYPTGPTPAWFTNEHIDCLLDMYVHFH